MQKIFSTQLTGIFNNINKEEFDIEDAARLLAQALVGEGSIYIVGFEEMAGIIEQALNGREVFPSCKPLLNTEEVTTIDRVLLFSRTNHHPESLALAKKLEEKAIPFVSVATSQEGEEAGLDDFSHVHINLKLKRGLVPTDKGERIGYPSLLIALYVLHLIQFTLIELIEEYNE